MTPAPDGNQAADSVEQWLHTFAVTLRTEMLKYYPSDTAILASRLGLDVLEHFGVSAVPEPVTVKAFTKDAHDALLAGKSTRDIGYTVGIGNTGELTPREAGGRKWDGHLVIRTEAQTRLIDLSIDQIHRPEHGLHINTALVSPPFDLTQWQAGLYLPLVTDDGTVVVYHRLEDTRWRRGEDWCRARPLHETEGIVATTIRRMETMPPPDFH